MPQRKRKPTSPGRRFQTVADFSDITKTTPERSLTEKKTSTGGRNNYGRKTARHRGGGHKRQYRVIDFRRNKDGVPAKVAAVEYDPNRSCRILLLHYHDGEKRYILAPRGVEVGDDLAVRPGQRDQGRQRPAAALHPGRHRRPQRGDASPAVAARWPEALGFQRPAGGQGGRPSPPCACPAPRCGGSPSTAGPRSARSATRSTSWSRSARPAETAGRASARSPAVWP